MNEPFARLVEAYLAGALDEAGEARLLGYLRTAPAAVEHLRAMAALDDALRDLAGRRTPAPAVRQAVVARIQARGQSRAFRARVAGRIVAGRRRRLGLRLFGGLLAAACLVFAVLAGRGGADAETVANLERDDGGLVQVLRAGRNVADADLRSGDRLLGDGGSAMLRFHDGTRIRLGGGFAATLAAGQRRDGSGGGKRILLERGELAAEVAHQPAGEALIVATPQARITVVGTVFTISVAGRGTRLAVSEGRVRFSDRILGGTIEVAAGASAVARSEPAARAPVFQADFDAPDQLVRIGGTGVLLADPAVSRTIRSESPLVAGGGSHVNGTMREAGGPNRGVAVFSPAGARSSFACFNQGTLVSAGRTRVVLNGGFDLFVRLAAKDPSDLGSGAGRSGAWFFPLAIVNRSGGRGLDLSLVGLTDGTISLKLESSAGTPVIGDVVRIGGAGTASTPATAKVLLDSAPDLLGTAGSTWHVAFTLATDRDGVITARLFAVPEAVAIDTRSEAALRSQATFTLDAAAVGSAPISAGGWGIGMWVGRQGLGTSVDYDVIRLYDADPLVFPLPGEPLVGQP